MGREAYAAHRRKRGARHPSGACAAPVRSPAYPAAPLSAPARAARPARPAVRSRRPLPPWPADRRLRAWQAAALAALHAHAGDAFLASATPAAGKTTFGLRVAWELLGAGRAARVVVVAPTTHIARQWALDAARYGLDLEPNRPNAAGPEPRDRHGVAVTYASVAAGPALHAAAARRTPTLVIADEPHHLGEQASWGQAATRAFGHATFRLLLSGTPFRSDNAPIPWVRYDADGLSCADFTYGYTDALLDRVCRPVTFHPYDGDMEWVSHGRRRSAAFSVALPAAEAARRLRTALDADGDWVADVLRDADALLGRLRAGPHPEAGGLVVAVDKAHAERLAERLAAVSGEAPTVVTSDAPDASARIARFAAGWGRWLVAVLMVSEGVDVPRLRVGVYATSARTELFFRQVVGRFVRRTPTPREQMSHLFLPADPRLKALALQVEEERNHALVARPEGELEPPDPRERGEPGATFRALSSTARRESDVLRTTAPGETLSLFGEPEPPAPPAPAPAPVVAAATVPAAPERAPAPAEPAPSPAARPTHEPPTVRRERLRAERRELVAVVARRTGEPYKVVHARINRATGARSVTAATADQLERGNRMLAREAR